MVKDRVLIGYFHRRTGLVVILLITCSKEASLASSSTEKELRRVLQTIARFQEQHPNYYMDDTDIAKELSLSVQEVRDYLDLLEQQGKIQSANSHDGHSAVLTAKGRTELRDPEYASQAVSAPVFNFSGSFQGALFNIQSTLTNVSQTINAAPRIDQVTKDELQTLVEQLKQELQHAPPDRVEDAETVAETAKALVETVTKDKPNKPLVTITADGLKQAAKNIADILPTVFTIATQITERIQPLLP